MARMKKWLYPHGETHQGSQTVLEFLYAHSTISAIKRTFRQRAVAAAASTVCNVNANVPGYLPLMSELKFPLWLTM